MNQRNLLIALFIAIAGILFIGRPRLRPLSTLPSSSVPITLPAAISKIPSTSKQTPPLDNKVLLANSPIWTAKEYKIIPSDPGIVAVERKGEILSGLRPEITLRVCEAPHSKEICARFPSGQSLVTNKELDELLNAQVFQRMFTDPKASR